jgi:hypothetical protein
LVRAARSRCAQWAWLLATVCLLAVVSAAAQTAPASAAAKPAAAKPAPPSEPPIPLVQFFGVTPPKPPSATLVWSVALDKNSLSAPERDSQFTGQRRAVFVADRVVAIFELAPEVSRGGRPVRRFRLTSVDAKTGEIKAREETEANSFPSLYATDDDHIVVGHASLTRLNPDLTESGEHYAESADGHILGISPDGSTLARRASRETELLNADTLTSTGIRIKGPQPSANSKHFVLSDAPIWAQQFPKDLAFLTLFDQQAPHLLLHGYCGGTPVFLAEEKILTLGCGKITILDLSGTLIKELPLGAAYGRFAGVSRDTSKFAILSSNYPIGDPSYRSTEVFTLYSAESYEAVATITPETLPEEHSWSAFSRDGTAFLCGGPKRLAVYKLP